MPRLKGPPTCTNEGEWLILYPREPLEALRMLQRSPSGITTSAWCPISSTQTWGEWKVTSTSSPSVWLKRDTKWWLPPTPTAKERVSATWRTDWRSTTSRCRSCTTSPHPPPSSTASRCCAVCLWGNGSPWCIHTARSPPWPTMHCFTPKQWAWTRYLSPYESYYTFLIIQLAITWQFSTHTGVHRPFPFWLCWRELCADQQASDCVAVRHQPHRVCVIHL